MYMTPSEAKNNRPQHGRRVLYVVNIDIQSNLVVSGFFKFAQKKRGWGKRFAPYKAQKQPVFFIFFVQSTLTDTLSIPPKLKHIYVHTSTKILSFKKKLNKKYASSGIIPR